MTPSNGGAGVLRKAWQFRFVYDQGRKALGSHLVVFYATPPEGHREPEIGVVASKKVGSAVRRSRAKRLMREAVRRVEPALNDRNIWIVVVARATIVEQSAAAVEDDLRQALHDAGLLSRS